MSDSAPPFPSDRYPSVKGLCLAVIGKFRSSALKSEERGLGPGAQSRPVEAQYQDEFYRACYALLGIYTFPQNGLGRGKMAMWTSWSSLSAGPSNVLGMEIDLKNTSLGFR